MKRTRGSHTELTLDEAARRGPLALLTQDEVAAVLRRSPRTIERWRIDGNGPKFTRCGRRCVAYTVASVLEFAGIDAPQAAA
jgi:hypothetical protein